LKASKNFSWALMGQVLNVVSQFVIITSLARIGTVSTVGTYGLISAIVSPLQLLFLMDINKLIVTDQNLENTISHYYFSIIINAILLITLSTTLIFIIYKEAAITFDCLTISLYWSLTNYREYYYSIYQKIERLDKLGKSLMYSSILNMVVFPVVFFLTKSMSISFLFLSIDLFLFLIFFEIKSCRNVSNLSVNQVKVDLSVQKKIWKKGYSLGSTAFFTSFKSNIPRYIIEYVLKSRTALGYYTLFMQCLNVLGTLNQTAAKTYIGRLTSFFYAEKTKFYKLLARLCGLSILGGLVVLAGILLIGKFLISIVFGAVYADASYILIWLLIARIFVLPTTYLRIAQVLLNQIHIQMVIMLSGGLLLIVLFFAFFKGLNIQGVLYAITFSEFFIFISTLSMVINGARKFKAIPG
jgi:O-antigen/teichoic acid export membrane protein